MTTASIVSTDLHDKNKEVSPVGIPSIAYEEMYVLWELIHDLLGGTYAMREARTKWLPQEPAETSVAYDARLNRSILFNGYRDTLNKLKDRPFTREIGITDIPDELSYLEKDVDGNGKSLETFCKEVLENIIKYGLCHILVNHTRVEDIEEGKVLTKEQEKRLGVRVYLVNVSPANLIGWQTRQEENKTKITQIRIKSTEIEPDGDYGDARTTYIKVYNEDSWEIHKQDDDNEDKYELIEEGISTLGFIPLVSIYASAKGIMVAEPPLMDLAWLNLVHWQSYSDQRNILRFSRFGLIFGKGMPEKMIKDGALEIGPSKAYLIAAKDADMKYVESEGRAIEAGRKDIEDIEQKMRVLGNQPLMRDLPNTATAEKIDEGRTVSQLQSWVRSLENGIKEALKLACQWRKITPKDTMGVDIYRDFEALVLGGEDKELLLKIREAGEITNVRFLKEMKRRSVFSQDMDPETEAEEIMNESGKDLENFIDEEDNEDEEEMDEE